MSYTYTSTIGMSYTLAMLESTNYDFIVTLLICVNIETSSQKMSLYYMFNLISLSTYPPYYLLCSYLLAQFNPNYLMQPILTTYPKFTNYNEHRFRYVQPKTQLSLKLKTQPSLEQSLPCYFTYAFRSRFQVERVECLIFH